jgi:VCBS repeat-containing protein
VLSNYTVTYVAGTFSITKAAATVTAPDKTKAYGAADPALTATATGFTAADAATITVSATRASGEAVGSYATTATASGAALSNYTVTYVAGTFSITKAAATVTAGGGTKAYGASDPPLSATTQTGFTTADAATITLTSTRATGEAVGSYATSATASGAALSNYTVTYVAGVFTITAASSGNRAPVATNDSYATNQATVLNIAAPGVLTNDTDPDAGDTRTAVLAGAPGHGTLTLYANGGFRYTPNASYTGTDTFRYQAKDAAGALSNTATVTITITPFGASLIAPATLTPVNDVRIAANDSYSTIGATVPMIAGSHVLTQDPFRYQAKVAVVSNVAMVMRTVGERRAGVNQ